MPSTPCHPRVEFEACSSLLNCTAHTAKDLKALVIYFDSKISSTMVSAE